MTHANRKHHCWQIQLENVEMLRIEHPKTPNGPESSEDLDRFSTSDVGDGVHNSDSGLLSEDPCPDSMNCIDSIEKEAGLFLLLIKKRHRLTQSAVSFAVSSVKKLIGDACDDFRMSVIKNLTEQGVDTNRMNLHFEAPNPFHGFETEYLQTKFFKEHFGLVVISCVHVC